jgi:DNA-binding beta-propeller fold protein YncE
VTPITTATNEPGKPIRVGIRPRMIAITPDGKTAYVVNQGTGPGRGSGSVTPITTATNKPGKPIDLTPAG